ncbi:MAG: Ig-like domain-containing protein [Polyangiaceae bacterium]
MSRVSLLGALLVGLCVLPLGCELITGDVNTDFGGAGGVPASGGEAGESGSKGGSVVAGGGSGGSAAGSPESGAGGAGDSNGMAGDSGSAGMAGDSGAAGMAGDSGRCNTAADCPGSNDECKTRTCVSHECGVTFSASGTAVAAQTTGDCLQATCDGAGNVANIADNTDPPADDGNACTDETCAVGVPQHPAKTNGTSCNDGNACTTVDTCQSGTCSGGAAVSCTALDECHSAGTCSLSTGLCSNPLKSTGSACTQGGGSVCSAAGSCVPCLVAADCTGTDTECHVRTCTNNTCGVNNIALGTATAVQTAGDCQQNECDGAGQIAPFAHDADVPADDGNQCTNEVCTSGVASHPQLAAGSACSQGGDSVCDSSGACTNATVLSTSPGESASVQTDTAIAVTFNVPMTPGTLNGQTTAGACTASVQVSSDDFTTCVAFAAAAAVMSAGNTVATFAPAPLLPSTTYRIRVTTAAQSAANSALAAQFTQVFGFATP